MARSRFRTGWVLLGTVALFALSAFSVSVARSRSPVEERYQCPAVSQVRWAPATPAAGTLFRVIIDSISADAMERIPQVRLAGEPLHFRVDGDSASAFAAAPIDSTDGLSLQFTCSERVITRVRIPTTAGDYPLERLSVAPRFGTRPDSALAARQRREAQRAAAVSEYSHLTPRLWTEPFAMPRTSRVTSGFGGGRTFNGAVTSRHMGTDYAGAVGAPIRAANRGIARIVDAFYLGGNVVYLDHGEGFVTAYLHMSKQRVAVGDTVVRGQVIGEVGATGRVTGPHLHVIARFGNVTFDAASLWNVQ